MRARLTFAAAVAACLVALHASAAQSPRDTLVRPVSWLAAHLNDPNLVLLHVGDRGEYDAAHLPGARYISMDDLSVSDHSGVGLHLEMLAPDVLRQHLQSFGISNASQIVVYYGKDWISPATRVIFTLDYAGLGDHTVLLDGGQEAWAREGHPVTAAVPPAQQGTLSPLTIKPIVVDAAYVRAHLGAAKVAVVDGRSSSFYDGVDTGDSMGRKHRTGHIAGAKSVPFTELTDDRLMVRPSSDLLQIFTKAGVQPGDTIIGYCHIGQQATAMLFAARTLGHPVLLYDGSFEDWSRHADYPVETAAAK
jgi:thiosulfate/3-mercaptopyruvate sulfurtransferase